MRVKRAKRPPELPEGEVLIKFARHLLNALVPFWLNKTKITHEKNIYCRFLSIDF